jgi:hypothetical protein
MILKERILELINEAAYRGNSKTQPLISAIKERHPVTFYYSGPIKPKKDSVKRGSRINAEVVALGLTKKGYMAIRAYVQPPSTSKKGFQKHGWRTFLVTRMSNIFINDDKTFDEKRPGYREGDDKSFTVTYAKTDWGKEPEQVQPKAEPEKVTPQSQPEPIQKTEPISKELPEPKPVEKPKPEPTPVEPETDEPEIEEPESEELPQPKPEEKPKEEPEDNNLQESLKRIKRLMLL